MAEEKQNKEEQKKIEVEDSSEQDSENTVNSNGNGNNNGNGNGNDIDVVEKDDINLKDINEDRVVNSEISNDMKKAYIDYAMSVIVSRALPSAEDGLKPVHRRILYAMKVMGLEKGMTKKSARIVGECFTKDTQVLTTKGLVPIKKVDRGDFVYTQNGTQEVRELYEMPEKKLMKLSLNNGISVRATPSQKFKVLNKDLKYEWKEAKNLTAEDHIVIKADYPNFKENFKLRLFDNKYLELNENLAYIIGLFLSDGWIDKETNRIGFCSKSEGVISKVQHILEREFNYFSNIEIKNQQYHTNSGSLIQSQIYIIRINNRRLCNYLASTFNLIKKNAYTKEIPQQILLSPKKVIYSFLSGLIDGDGSIHKSRNVITYTSISEKLIDRLLLLTQQLSILGKKYVLEKKTHKFDNRIVRSNYPCYCIEFKGEFARKLANNLFLSEERKKKRASQLLTNNFKKSDFEIIPFAGNIIFSELSKKHIGPGWYKNNEGRKFRLGIKYPRGCKIRYSKDLKEKGLRKSQIINWNILGKLKKIGSEYYGILKEIIDNKVYFIKIKKIEKSRPEKTYDFAVKNEHEFIANGLVSHNCMGKYHPHGDMAIYDALVRMTQDFSLRYPLVKGQGNFGSLDGDNAAASRYTEAKLEKISNELLQDIDKETVKLIPNFDNSLKEPVVLPGKLPNLLINGSSGIAVGMTTNIPSHNLNEVCDGIIKCIDKPSVSIPELMEVIQGPDFPTGGKIVSENFKELYENGKASFVVRGKTKIEKKKQKENIIIEEVPYQTNKADLVKQIATLVKNKKLPDVSDVRDESSKGEVRVVVELKKDSNSQFTINRLFKSTKLQSRFDAVLVALVAGVPKQLNLKELIECYINHRRRIVRKRTEFDLRKAEAREHIVKGLLVALKNLDEVISMIKKSKTTKDASEALQKKYKLSEKQAKAILDTTLKQLTSLEHEKLRKEEKELIEKIKRLKEILDDENEIYKIIKRELRELKKNYGDDRRSKIIKDIKDIKEKDLVQKKDVIVTITDKGYIKRMSYKAYHEQKRGGQGVIGAQLTEEDFVRQAISCSTHDYLLLFTEKGRLFWLKTYKIRESQRTGKGQAIVNLLNIKDDTITKVMAVRDFNDFLFIATKKGKVKRIELEKFSKPRKTGVRIIKLPLDNSDKVIGVKRIKKRQDVMLMTKKGQAIKFSSEEVRSMGRASYGVTGIKLKDKDIVVSLEIVDKGSILTITEKGYGKRSDIKDYRKTSRGGKGVRNIKVTDRTGEVVSTLRVLDKDVFLVTTKKGIIIKTTAENIRVMGRATQGVRIMKLKEGDKVSDIAKLTKEEGVDEDKSD